MSAFTRFFSRVFKPSQPRRSRSIFFSSGGTVINQESALEVAAFHRAVTYISTQMAKLPIEFKDRNNRDVPTNLDLLLNRRPNSEMTAFTFKTLMYKSALVTGNGIAEIVRDSVGRVVELYPIPPQSYETTRINGKLYYRIMNGSLSGEDVYLEPKDVFHLKNFLSYDGINGASIVEYAKESLGIAHGADKMANGLFANAGLPSGVLKHPGRLNQEAAIRIKESWASANGGRKAGGTALLEDGLSFEPISMAPDVLQFLESRKFSVLEIARFFGLPPTKLFDSEAATYNNIEHSNLEVAVDTIDAWARNTESEIDFKLLANRTDVRSEMDLYSVFRGDMKTRAAYFKDMLNSGSITPNEIRKKEGFAPYAEGDNFYIPTNNLTPTSRINEVIDSQVKKGEETTPSRVDEAIVNYLSKNQ